MRAYTVTSSRGTQRWIRVSPSTGRLLRSAYVRVGCANGVPQGIAVHPDVAGAGESFSAASIYRTHVERELRIVPERAPSLNALVLVQISRESFRRVVWTFGPNEHIHPDRRQTLLMQGYEFNAQRAPDQYRLLIMEPGASFRVLQTEGPKRLMRDIRVAWVGETISFERYDEQLPEQFELPRIS